VFRRATVSGASASDRRKATERSVPRRCAKELFRAVEPEPGETCWRSDATSGRLKAAPTKIRTKNQKAAWPGVRGNGITSRMLAIPVA